MMTCTFQEVSLNETTLPQFGYPLLQQPSDDKLREFYFHEMFGSHRKYWVQCILIALFSTVGCLGVLMNGIVVVLIIYHRAVTNITNIFVLVLALSDMCICLFNIPLQILYDIVEQMPVNSLICKGLFVSFAVPLHVSCLTMMFIAIDRYRIIIHPLRPRMKIPFALMLVSATVLYSFLHGLPVAWAINVQTPFSSLSPLFGMSSLSRNSTIPNRMDYYCVEQWNSPELRIVYSFHNTVMLFFLPLIVTSILYARVYFRLKGRVFRQRHSERKRRTTKILIAIVVCFTICWMPWNIFSFLLEVQVYLHSKNSHQTYEKLIEYDISKETKPNNCTVSMSRVSAETLMNSGILKDQQSSLHGNSLNVSFSHPFLSSQTWNNQQNVKTIETLMKWLALSSCFFNSFLYGWLNDSIRETFGRLKDKLRVSSSRGTGGGDMLLSRRNSPQKRQQPARFGAGDEKMEEEEELCYDSVYRMSQPFSSRYTLSLFEASTKRTSLNPSSVLWGPSPRNSLLPGSDLQGNRASIPMNMISLSPNIITTSQHHVETHVTTLTVSSSCPHPHPHPAPAPASATNFLIVPNSHSNSKSFSELEMEGDLHSFTQSLPKTLSNVPQLVIDEEEDSLSSTGPSIKVVEDVLDEKKEILIRYSSGKAKDISPIKSLFRGNVISETESPSLLSASRKSYRLSGSENRSQRHNLTKLSSHQADVRRPRSHSSTHNARRHSMAAHKENRCSKGIIHPMSSSPEQAVDSLKSQGKSNDLSRRKTVTIKTKTEESTAADDFSYFQMVAAKEKHRQSITRRNSTGGHR